MGTIYAKEVTFLLQKEKWIALSSVNQKFTALAEISLRDVTSCSNIMLVTGVCIWLGRLEKNGGEIKGKNGVPLKR